MTYIIGLSINGINSIISDVRVTWNSSTGVSGQNTALKIGFLFPGCIFGRVGDAKRSEKFIVRAKNELHGITNEFECWNRFCKYAADYQFAGGRGKSTDKHFQILLSTRATGIPQFYIFDSQSGLRLDRRTWIKLGSGRKTLDELMDRYYQKRIEVIALSFQHKEVFPEIVEPARTVLFSYFISFWLTQIAYSQKTKELERLGVGGVFHFIYQTCDAEQTQKPALYLLLDAIEHLNKRYLLGFRTCFIEESLVYSTIVPDPSAFTAATKNAYVTVHNNALINKAALPLKKHGYSPSNYFEDFMEQHKETILAKDPLYYFCGYGCRDFETFRVTGAHITTPTIVKIGLRFPRMIRVKIPRTNGRMMVGDYSSVRDEERSGRSGNTPARRFSRRR